MSDTRKPSAQDRNIAALYPHEPEAGFRVEPLPPEVLDDLTEGARARLAEMYKEAALPPRIGAEDFASTLLATETLHSLIQDIATQYQTLTAPMRLHASYVLSLTTVAENMESSIEALGPALAEIETSVSPQLARSVAATENAWRELETDFGLLSSREVSELVGSKSPNRSYASEQRSKGRLVAVKRPGGLRYPGFQIDPAEHAIRPVMAELISVAVAAGRSEASLALWMTSRTGYLDGDRPVDQLSHPDKVVEAARQSFNVQW